MEEEVTWKNGRKIKHRGKERAGGCRSREKEQKTLLWAITCSYPNKKRGLNSEATKEVLISNFMTELRHNSSRGAFFWAVFSLKVKMRDCCCWIPRNAVSSRSLLSICSDLISLHRGRSVGRSIANESNALRDLKYWCANLPQPYEPTWEK